MNLSGKRVVCTLPTSSTVQSALRNVAYMPSTKMNDTKAITLPTIVSTQPIYISYEAALNESTWLAYHLLGRPIGWSMTVDIDGTIRYTETIDEETTPHGDFFLSRGILTEDAPLEGNDDGTLGMFQDYQLEVYFPLNENQTVHFFTIWRDVRYTSALDFSLVSSYRTSSWTVWWTGTRILRLNVSEPFTLPLC